MTSGIYRRRTRPRAVTLALREIRRDVDLESPTEVQVQRPLTRGDCRDGPRPCPWVGCRHHLYLDVNEETGSIKINFPDLDPDELTETCSVDAGERGGMTLEEVGEALAVTRERARQMEVRALLGLRRAGRKLDPIR